MCSDCSESRLRNVLLIRRRMHVSTSVIAIGVLHLISPLPVPENYQISNTLLDSFSCNDKEEGFYRHPISCSLYYRCRTGQREVYKCIEGYKFNEAVGQCEKNASCDFSTCWNLGNGIYPNYTSSCQNFIRCEESELVQRVECANGERFSTRAGRCTSESDGTCIEPICNAPGCFALPGTSCRLYYKCDSQGKRTHYSCPGETVFDVKKQKCVKNAQCFEPLCVGRINGWYPDTSHECRRSFHCEGGELKAVRGCSPNTLSQGDTCIAEDLASCGAPETTAVLTSVKCEGLQNGPYASSDCRGYFRCNKGQVVEQGMCPRGTKHNGHMCIPSVLALCPEDKCLAKEDGFHSDFSKGCNAFFMCLNEKLIIEGRCPSQHIWNGTACTVPEDGCFCEGVEPWSGCTNMEAGLYQDLHSRCHQYHYCDGLGNRTLFSCPNGQLFNGTLCVPENKYICPESCDVGYHHHAGSGCHSYFYCTAGGHQITYLCPRDTVFNGVSCVDSSTFNCPEKTFDCNGKQDGYHSDETSGCTRYYYCLREIKVRDLMCSDGKLFDGQQCIHNYQCPPSTYEGPIISSSVALEFNKNCTQVGFTQDLTSACRTYFFCINGERTQLTCPGNEIFNGHLCVDPIMYTCPNTEAFQLQ